MRDNYWYVVMEKCTHFLENTPGSCLMLGKNRLELPHLRQCFMYVSPVVHAFYLEVSAVGHSQKVNVEFGPFA